MATGVWHSEPVTAHARFGPRAADNGAELLALRNVLTQCQRDEVTHRDEAAGTKAAVGLCRPL